MATGGGSGNGSVQVELFGPVTLIIGDDRIAVTGYPAQLLALLAAARGAPVAATQLLDSLWPEAPNSGLNVVQRHLSALRRRLRASGHRSVADRLIVHRGGSYLLDPAVAITDLDLLDAHDAVVTGPSDTGDGPAPRWWNEPLAGLPWEPFVTLRAVLDRVALEAAHRWLAAHRSEIDPATISMALSGLANRHPGDELLWSTLREALYLSTRRTSPPNLAAMSDDGERAHLELLTLGEPIATWLAGDTAGALDVVDRLEPILGPDTTMRARRWFSTLDPSDGLVRLLLSDLVAESRSRPYNAERSVVSLDAYTLAHHPGGLDRCRREVTASPTDVALLRAQRVLTFMLLSAPVGEGLADAIADLSAIDHPEAEIESLRFSTTLAAREGRFDAVPSLLDQVSRAVAVRHPGQEAWYADIARRVLADCPMTRHVYSPGAEATRFFEHPVNQSVIDLSHLWHQLDGGVVNTATSPMIRQLVTQLSPSSAHAIGILHLLALGRVEAAGDRLRPFRGSLVTRPRESLAHLLLVAAGRVAVATRDGHLAAEVSTAVEPFAGEWLGAWPFDLIIEPADQLLDRLKSLD